MSSMDRTVSLMLKISKRLHFIETVYPSNNGIVLNVAVKRCGHRRVFIIPNAFATNIRLLTCAVVRIL